MTGWFFNRTQEQELLTWLKKHKTDIFQHRLSHYRDHSFENVVLTIPQNEVLYTDPV